MATINALRSRKVTTAIGSVIEGADLTRALGDADRDFIGRELYERGVVFIPGPALSSGQMKEVVSHYATPRAAKFAEGAGGDTGYRADFGLNKQHTAIWHADGTFAEEPAVLTALQAISLPDVGGDTCWSSMYAAYDALSAPMRAMLNGLTAIHSVEPVARRMGEHGRRYAERASAEFGAERAHPVVRVHPETGRRALYVNSSWVTRIVELSEPESAHVLAMLFEHIKQPEFCMRWHWSPGDLAIWDNRCVQHYAVPDYDGERVMQRVDTEGQRPVGVMG